MRADGSELLRDRGETLLRFDGCWIRLKRQQKRRTRNYRGVGGKGKREF